MRIGDLARETGVNIETIRYYEHEGILPAPARDQNNYRLYTKAHRRRLHFVRRARDLGFTLKDLRALLSMIDSGGYTCAEVQALGRRHLLEVRGKIADLSRMEKMLADILSRCSGEQTPDCSMIEELFDQ